MKIRNTFIIFLVSGFWHGANWTFIVWGALNALYFLPLLLSNTNRNNMKIVAYDKNWPTFKELVSILITFTLTVFAWIFFRANSLTHAITYIKDIFTSKLISLPEIRPTYVIILVLIFIFIEWVGRRNNYAIEKLFFDSSVLVRWSFYFALIIAIFIFSTKEQEFIYFQF